MKIDPTLRLLMLLALSATSVGCCWYRRAEETCPTDARRIYPACAGEEAVRSCPCGPDTMFYGHKPTCWNQWPEGWDQYQEDRCGPCGRGVEAPGPYPTATQPAQVPQEPVLAPTAPPKALETPVLPEPTDSSATSNPQPRIVYGPTAPAAPLAELEAATLPAASVSNRESVDLEVSPSDIAAQRALERPSLEVLPRTETSVPTIPVFSPLVMKTPAVTSQAADAVPLQAVPAPMPKSHVVAVGPVVTVPTPEPRVAQREAVDLRLLAPTIAVPERPIVKPRSTRSAPAPVIVERHPPEQIPPAPVSPEVLADHSPTTEVENAAPQALASGEWAKPMQSIGLRQPELQSQFPAHPKTSLAHQPMSEPEPSNSASFSASKLQTPEQSPESLSTQKNSVTSPATTRSAMESAPLQHCETMLPPKRHLQPYQALQLKPIPISVAPEQLDSQLETFAMNGDDLPEVSTHLVNVLPEIALAYCPSNTPTGTASLDRVDKDIRRSTAELKYCDVLLPPSEELQLLDGLQLIPVPLTSATHPAWHEASSLLYSEEIIP